VKLNETGNVKSERKVNLYWDMELLISLHVVSQKTHFFNVSVLSIEGLVYPRNFKF
jgi:hypothetical protein